MSKALLEISGAGRALPALRMIPYASSILQLSSRKTQPTIAPLRNDKGGPNRIEKLKQDVAAANQENLRLFEQNAEVLPLRAVSDEALRMLDSYLNRTDELHDLSTEMLAQAFTGASQRMPEVHAAVPIASGGRPRLPPRPEMKTYPMKTEVSNASSRDEIARRALGMVSSPSERERATPVGFGGLRGQLFNLQV